MKIISGILIALTIYLNARHSWSGLTNSMKPAEAKMLSGLGISQMFNIPIGLVSLAVCVLVLFPKTFFIGNLLHATIILLIMALALQTNNLKIVLIEIPFLLLPLLLIWLGHPLKK
jgi:phage shock protein PspC (stress-responsive transcriptional regulator)